ncbi:PAS domain S-box protein [Chloroflexota bacterium]
MNNEQYRYLFQLSREALFTVLPNGRPVEANRACLQLFGYTSNEMAMLRMTDLYADEVERTKINSKIATGAEHIETEVRLRKKNGTLMDCHCAFSVTHDRHGRPLAIRGAVRDITDDKRSRDALKSTEESYRALFNNTLDAISLVRPDGLLLDANPAFLRLLGYSASDIGRTNVAGQYVDSDGREQFLEQMAAHGVVEDEVRLKTADGRVLDFARSAVKRVDDEGNVVAFQSVHRDVTKQKQMDAALRESHANAQRMLEGLMHVIEQMTETRDAYTAGHQRRVASLAVAIARQMGLPEDTCVYLVDIAARVHDIGKIAVPAEILAKPGRLNGAELALVKTHSQVGYDILSRAELPYPVALAVLQHHERLDGSGYPQGIAADDVLPEASILAVADVVEAMSSHRPYRPALGLGVALEEIRDGAGMRYDSDVVDACVAVFARSGFEFPD